MAKHLAHGAVRILALPLIWLFPAMPADAEPPAFRSGGSFVGTFAYDAQVGYDYGEFDDNGREPSYYRNNLGRQPRMPGKRSDPGDIDYFDPYYHGYLYNDGTLGDYNDLRASLHSHGKIGRQTYWRRSSYIPLRYDDFGEYQSFRYDLGGQP
jgi:hypothetical protein